MQDAARLQGRERWQRQELDDFINEPALSGREPIGDWLPQKPREHVRVYCGGVERAELIHESAKLARSQQHRVVLEVVDSHRSRPDVPAISPRETDTFGRVSDFPPRADSAPATPIWRPVLLSRNAARRGQSAWPMQYTQETALLRISIGGGEDTGGHAALPCGRLLCGRVTRAGSSRGAAKPNEPGRPLASPIPLPPGDDGLPARQLFESSPGRKSRRN